MVKKADIVHSVNYTIVNYFGMDQEKVISLESSPKD